MRDGREGRNEGVPEREEPMAAPLPERLIEAVRAEYHVPSAAPRDEIWARIDATRRAIDWLVDNGLAHWVFWLIALGMVLALGTVLSAGVHVKRTA